MEGTRSRMVPIFALVMLLVTSSKIAGGLHKATN